jgi:hypothetical protein
MNPFDLTPEGMRRTIQAEYLAAGEPYGPSGVSRWAAEELPRRIVAEEQENRLRALCPADALPDLLVVLPATAGARSEAAGYLARRLAEGHSVPDALAIYHARVPEGPGTDVRRPHPPSAARMREVADALARVRPNGERA